MLEQVVVQVGSESSKNDDRRLAYIDTLRGLASVQVLLSHAMLAFFSHIAFAEPSSGTVIGYLAASPLFFAIDGASAVCIFFILSGYVLTPVFMHSRATNGAVICSRFLRLGIPAVAGCALSAILFQFFGGYHEIASALSRSQWLADGWHPADDLWFVRDALVNGIILGFQDSSLALWFGVPAASLATTANSYVTPLWTLSIEFYGSILVLLLARSRSWTLLLLVAIVLSRTYLLCFLVGHVAARFDLGGKKLLMPWPVAAAVAIFGLAVCLTSHFWSPELVVKLCASSVQILPPCPLAKPDYLMRVYGAAVFTVGVMQCPPVRTFLAHERLGALGRLSFPIYLTHWPIIFGFGSFLLVILMPWAGSLPARLLALTLSIAVTIVASMCFQPVDQIALRVSRAWRKQGLLGGSAPVEIVSLGGRKIARPSSL
jgi:peptidoglycan/LPS O-acetylase OafA/YrhL